MAESQIDREIDREIDHFSGDHGHDICAVQCNVIWDLDPVDEGAHAPIQD